MKSKIILAAAVALVGWGCAHSKKVDSESKEKVPEARQQEREAKEVKAQDARKPRGE